jgi:hypothetical protein
VSQTRAPREPRKNRNGFALCGALGSDITRAVEIISVEYDLPGSMAYRLLVQRATQARLSVQEMAALIAQSADPPDRGLAG